MKEEQTIFVVSNVNHFTGVYNGVNQESFFVTKVKGYVFTPEEFNSAVNKAVQSYVNIMQEQGFHWIAPQRIKKKYCSRKKREL